MIFHHVGYPMIRYNYYYLLICYTFLIGTLPFALSSSNLFTQGISLLYYAVESSTSWCAHLPLSEISFLYLCLDIRPSTPILFRSNRTFSYHLGLGWPLLLTPSVIFLIPLSTHIAKPSNLLTLVTLTTFPSLSRFAVYIVPPPFFSTDTFYNSPSEHFQLFLLYARRAHWFSSICHYRPNSTLVTAPFSFWFLLVLLHFFVKKVCPPSSLI